MTETNPPAETETVEQGSWINRDNVAGWDANNPDKRYKMLNTSPRHTQAGQEGYLLKDRETGAIHITNLNTNLLSPNHRVNAANVSLIADEMDVTNIIIDELSRAVEYDHFISMDSVKIEYKSGENGWPDEVGDDEWDVKATVTTNS